MADGDTTKPFAQEPATISKDPTNNDRTIILDFSEALAAGTFTTADVSVTGGTLSSVTAITASQYKIVVLNVSGGSPSITVLANGYTDVAGNLGLASNPIAINNPGTQHFPAGVAGSPIQLALSDPSPGINDLVTVTVNGVPSGWTLNAGIDNGDGTWTVQTADPSSLTVLTPAEFAGAVVLGVNMSWTNTDGSAGNAYLPTTSKPMLPARRSSHGPAMTT